MRPLTEGEQLIQITTACQPEFISFGEEDDRRMAELQNILINGSGYFSDEYRELAEEFQASPKTQAIRGLIGIVMRSGSSKKTINEQLAQLNPTDEMRASLVDALRLGRRVREREADNIMLEAVGASEADPEWEVCASEQPRNLTYNTELAHSLFPTGDILIHTSYVDGIASTLNNGKLASSVTVTKEGLTPPDFSRSAYDFILFERPTISWSLNTIGAMPGSPHHIAGFIASPQFLQHVHGHKLFVPIDAGVHELQSVIPDVDTQEYRDQHAQIVIWHKVDKEAVSAMEKFHFTDSLEGTNLGATLRRMRNNSSPQPKKNALSTDDIQRMYRFKGAVTEFSTELLETQISPLAVLLQSFIDSGDYKEVFGNKVIGSIAELTDSQITILIDHGMTNFAEDEVRLAAEHMKEVGHFNKPNSIPLSSLVFTCSERDYDRRWRHVIAHSRHKPLAVLTFEGSSVRIPNGAMEKGRGDHRQLSRILRSVIPPTPNTLDWYSLLPDFDPSIIAQKDGASHMIRPSFAMQAKEPRFSTNYHS